MDEVTLYFLFKDGFFLFKGTSLRTSGVKCYLHVWSWALRGYARNYQEEGFAIVAPSCKIYGSGNWNFEYWEGLIVAEPGQIFPSSLFLRLAGKSKNIFLFGYISLAILTAGAMSVSPLTTTTISHSSLRKTLINFNAMETSVSFSSYRGIVALQKGQ